MKDYNYIDPKHYKKSTFEVWEMMLAIWGPVHFISHCEMTAMKYRMRLGNKPDQPELRDLEKAKWYEKKAIEIKKKYT